MMNNWNYKIELRNTAVFDKISKDFPDELKDFIIENNAASPDKNCIDINGVECVYDETLSFNEDETEASTVFSAMKAVNDKELIPFAKDPFGNHYCYSLSDGKVAFVDHEEDAVVETNLSLDEFIESLY